MKETGRTGVTVTTTPGCAYNDSNTTGFAAALATARRPDISHVVLALGLSGTLEGEGNDLLPSRFPVGFGLGLPGVQMQLLEKLAAVGKPVGKAGFLAPFYGKNSNICQDRLGTNLASKS